MKKLKLKSNTIGKISLITSILSIIIALSSIGLGAYFLEGSEKENTATLMMIPAVIQLVWVIIGCGIALLLSSAFAVINLFQNNSNRKFAYIALSINGLSLLAILIIFITTWY